MNDLDFLDDNTQLETTEMPPDGIKHRRHTERSRMMNMLKEEHLRDIMTEKPKPGEAFHLVSNGKYDYWTWTPTLLNLIGKADEFYGSTWTMNRQNVIELLELYDAGRIGSICMFTGTYFKRRESAVYATLMQGLQQRGQRFKAFENHTKIILLGNHTSGDYLVVEGSANMTANPRVEQHMITNDRALYEFHRAWMKDMLDK